VPGYKATAAEPSIQKGNHDVIAYSQHSLAVRIASAQFDIDGDSYTSSPSDSSDSPSSDS
jgi:hypothetical protein